jgi:uncharacterized protein YciI
MFIVNLTYKKPLEIVEQHVVVHRAYIEECVRSNYLIAAGPKNPRTGAFLISQLTDKAQLIDVMENDPFCLEGIAEYEIMEFKPVKYHPNFSCFIE